MGVAKIFTPGRDDNRDRGLGPLGAGQRRASRLASLAGRGPVLPGGSDALGFLRRATRLPRRFLRASSPTTALPRRSSPSTKDGPEWTCSSTRRKSCSLSTAFRFRRAGWPAPPMRPAQIAEEFAAARRRQAAGGDQGPGEDRRPRQGGRGEAGRHAGGGAGKGRQDPRHGHQGPHRAHRPGRRGHRYRAGVLPVLPAGPGRADVPVDVLGRGRRGDRGGGQDQARSAGQDPGEPADWRGPRQGAEIVPGGRPAGGGAGRRGASSPSGSGRYSPTRTPRWSR